MSPPDFCWRPWMICGRAKATTVRIAASPGSWLHSFACWAGFTPLQVGFRFEVVPLNPALDVAELSDSSAWVNPLRRRL